MIALEMGSCLPRLRAYHPRNGHRQAGPPSRPTREASGRGIGRRGGGTGQGGSGVALGAPAHSHSEARRRGRRLLASARAWAGGAVERKKERKKEGKMERPTPVPKRALRGHSVNEDHWADGAVAWALGGQRAAAAALDSAAPDVQREEGRQLRLQAGSASGRRGRALQARAVGVLGAGEGRASADPLLAADAAAGGAGEQGTSGNGTRGGRSGATPANSGGGGMVAASSLPAAAVATVALGGGGAASSAGPSGGGGGGGGGRTVALGSAVFRLRTHTFVRYGLNEAFDRGVELLMQVSWLCLS
jgi:hypothetical protein